MRKNLINLIKKILILFFKSSNIYRIRDDLGLKFRSARHKKKFDTLEFLTFLADLGINRGDTVFMQSSWSEFYNYEGRQNDIVNAVIDLIGPNGNLVMPAGSVFDFKSPKFDQLKTPTNSGIICEVFRRTKNVTRSIHYNSSVCAIGKDAEFLTNEHYKSYTSWDEYSPYYKLYSLNAKNLTLGLGKFYSYVTATHCIDSILLNELPYFKKIFSSEFEYEWVDKNGRSGTSKVLHREFGDIDLKRYSKFVECVPHINNRISNLDGFSVQLRPFVDKGLALGRSGKFLYKTPVPSAEDLVPYSKVS
jgi:aminoglycoside 3-N-acetyltransferase